MEHPASKVKLIHANKEAREIQEIHSISDNTQIWIYSTIYGYFPN